MSLTPVYRKKLIMLSDLYRDPHYDRVTRLVRTIYASTIHQARKKLYSYSYAIHHSLAHNIEELVADVLYDIRKLFPDSRVYFRKAIECDIICVEWF